MEKKYGLTFHRIRKQKGYKLTSFEEIGLSKSALSEFERGNSVPRFDKVVKALQLMGIPLYEFEQFVQYSNHEGIDKFFRELYPAYFGQEKAKIEDLMRKTSDKMLKISMKCLLLELDDDITKTITSSEQEFIIDYFENLQNWGIYELYILSSVIMQLPVREIIYLLKALREETQQQLGFIHYRMRIIQIAVKGAMKLIFSGQKEVSKELLDAAFNFTDPDDLFERNLVHFVRGFWCIHFGNKQEGYKKIDESLEIVKILSSIDIHDFLQSRVKKYLK